MLSELFDAYGERLVYATLGLGLAFLALIIVLWFVRSRGGPAPFLKGGRNRQPRLQVLDATAVDARRRLVLVRRDNVEHLIMIGGPTDIVVESGIGAIPFMTDVSQVEPLAINAQQVPTPQSKFEQSSPAATSLPLSDALRQEPIATQSADNNVSAVQEPTLYPEQKAKPVAPVSEPKHAPLQSEPAKTLKVEAPTAPPINTTPRPQTAAPTLTSKTVSATEASKPASSPVTTAAMRPRAPINALNTAGVATAGLAGATLSPSAQKVEPVLSDDAVTKKQVDELFGETRERVLPDIALPSITIDDEVSDKLRDDFESFLNAEIEKNAIDAPSVEPVKSTAPTLENTVITGANIDKDAQQQMARIFGELATKDS